ncbi:MAG: ABC transporter substrate-binding protein [Thermoplasmatota archaeon]
MQRLSSLAILALFVSMSFAGCFGNQPTTTTTNPTNPTTTGGTPPTADAVATPSPGIAGQATAFDGSVSNAGSGTIASIAWQFGDASTGTGTQTSHTYTTPGDYVVIVNVTNSAGLSASNAANLLYYSVSGALIAVKDRANATPPAAIIAASATSIQPGTSINFSGAASYAFIPNSGFDATQPIDASNAPFVPDTSVIKSYSWDFGDGTAAMSGNAANDSAVSHVFANPGLYAVKLTVTSPTGVTGSAIHSVYVTARATTGGVKNKDTFVTATIPGPQSMDPGYDYETGGGTIIQQVYEPLVYYNKDNVNSLVPILASQVPTKDNGGISADGLTWTFKIRTGVKFHDGTTLDAAAIKFSIDRAVILNDPNGAPRPIIVPIIKGAAAYAASQMTRADRDTYLAAGGVSAPDATTLVIKLDKPDPDVLARLAFTPASAISPTAVKAAHPERVALWGVATTPDGLPPASDEGAKRQITRDPWADVNMVGTGPFTLRAWLPNDRVILDRFDGYWGQKPTMKTVIIQYVDELNSRLLMLKAGDADEIYVAPRDIGRVLPDIQSISRVSTSNTLVIQGLFMTWNATSDCPKLPDGTAKCDLFSDLHVRKAIAMAINTTDYGLKAYKGTASATNGAIPRGLAGYDPNAPAPLFNPDISAAKAELAKSSAPNGFTVDIFYNTGNAGRTAGAELIKQYLAPLGITVNVQKESFGQLTADEAKHIIPMVLAGWAPDYVGTSDYIIPFYDSRNGYFTASFLMKDPAVESLIDQASAEQDAAKKGDLWKQANVEGVNNVLFVPLVQPSQVHVERTYVTGYYFNPVDSGQPDIGRYQFIGKAG